MRVAFINPQGNFDSRDSYWTTHPDFGGQLVYVKELAVAMSGLGISCDIITRRITDPDWPEFAGDMDSYPGVENVRIIRIPFGPEGFLKKEKLWPYLDQFRKGIIDFYRQDRTMPSFITGHYGDGGLVGAMLFKDTGIPYSFTAHSLGAQKLEKLLQAGEDRARLEEKYNFSYRIAAERIAMKCSAVNFVSTSMERYQQYSHRLYRDFVNIGDDSKFRVVPPGVNTSIFKSEPTDLDARVEEKLTSALKGFVETSRQNLPLIIVSSRLEPKKNHTGLVRAFSKDIALNEASNLLIVVRGMENPYDEYEKTDDPERAVLSEIIEIVRRNGVEKKVLFLNIESQLELAALYRVAGKLRSIFALTSLYEPFGLASIEAMACGLPVVATSNGGPSESLNENGVEYGVLVDPADPQDIARGLKRLINCDQDVWKSFRERAMNRVLDKYTWAATAKGYLDAIKELIKNTYPEPEIPDCIYTGMEIPFIDS